ncbi:hypothetical protein [Algibacter sp. PT7-4]|uniref:hypothetical protein n=1 Tax=Algibacter ulvanivorans TaxID=3400999 RepID=UPI003AAE5E09
MNLTKKANAKKYKIIAISIWLVISLFVSITFKLTPFVCILFFFSGGGILFLIDPLLKPIIKTKQKKLYRKQQIINKHKKIVKKAGYKQFEYKNKYVVWAKNKYEADKLFNLKIAPLLNKHPNKEFFYISKACNNINLK